MERRIFCKNSLVGGAAIMANPLIKKISPFDMPAANAPTTLMGNRFVTFCIMIRTSPWEVSRDVKLIKRDEGYAHTLKVVQDMRETFAKNNPNGRLTWGFTLNALEDKRSNYVDIRKYVAECQHKYGDEVSYFPGYFPAMYLSRHRINVEMTEAIQRITDMVGGGYRPKAIMGGFLSADNLAYLAEKEKIHVAHAVIWSQHETDGGGADGSPSYPFYPSKEHFCKPAQGKSDFIDCVNLDGWSVDFLCALQSGNIYGTTPFNGAASRRGVGPIESYGDWGLDIGHQSVMHTQSIHFDRGFELNGFGWIPNIWEAALVKIPERNNWDETFALRALEKWVGATVQKWPDVKFVTFGEYGELWRSHFPDNEKWNYRFEEKGLGIGNSWGDEEIKWYMNKEFRLATLRNWHKNTPARIVDFTRYDLPAKEPADPSPEKPVKDWSLMNRINQKGLRLQDAPILPSELKNDEKQLIAKYYPDFFK
ncbi:DUF3863 domain-containing protein [Mucilaginibacter corticis]|uniref:DUF3863 domain-containing protein n=1 Tax=Mucilaginibacter corticis TaxID=2597670 RepID=A0A556MUQ7_9SPHI|nr:DUF3863 domain-containing protein [Mucilaginibacter corticis]TSJ43671.1 DUF3863 domain-containing protein [Mucilaginibacter corticis]